VLYFTTYTYEEAFMRYVVVVVIGFLLIFGGTALAFGPRCDPAGIQSGVAPCPDPEREAAKEKAQQERAAKKAKAKADAQKKKDQAAEQAKTPGQEAPAAENQKL
jgi:hypothetical protein